GDRGPHSPLRGVRPSLPRPIRPRQPALRWRQHSLVVRAGGGARAGRDGDGDPAASEQGLNFLSRVAAWTSPAVLTALAVRVVLGDFTAPILALLIVLAPLGALLASSRDETSPEAATIVVAAISVSLVLGGSILAATDV